MIRRVFFPSWLILLPVLFALGLAHRRLDPMALLSRIGWLRLAGLFLLLLLASWAGALLKAIE